MIVKKSLIILIKLYQKTLSPDHGLFAYRHPFGYCKFTPTCSQYALKAIEQHGALRGFILSVKRVVRCNPFSRNGYDPVPKNINKLANLS